MLLCEPFECATLNIRSTTNECYDCDRFPKCELAIDKIFEEDENRQDLLYEKNKCGNEIKPSNIIPISHYICDDEYEEDKKDYRWWMN